MAFVSSFLLSTKPCPRFFLICFARYIKSFYQSSLENEVGFRDIMNVFLNILAKSFVDERALITTTLISSCHWKTLVPFCLQKKIPENAFLTIIVNYREIEQKSKYIGYFMIYNVIYSLLVFTEKLEFFWRFSRNSWEGLLYPQTQTKYTLNHGHFEYSS